MPKATPETQTNERRWHPYYRDPNGDVILCSSDNVHFRSSIYRLSEASSVFAGMFDVGRHNGVNRTHEVIEVTYSTTVVEAFLGIVTVLKPSDLHLDVKTAGSLRSMVDLYDCDKAKQMVLSALIAACLASPLEGIIYASDQNDLPLARKAIKLVKSHITRDPSPFKTTNGFWPFIKALRPEWQMPLRELIIADMPSGKKKCAIRDCGDARMRVAVKDDWSAVGDCFRP